MCVCVRDLFGFSEDRYIGSKLIFVFVCLFVYLFVYLFICLSVVRHVKVVTMIFEIHNSSSYFTWAKYLYRAIFMKFVQCFI